PVNGARIVACRRDRSISTNDAGDLPLFVNKALALSGGNHPSRFGSGSVESDVTLVAEFIEVSKINGVRTFLEPWVLDDAALPTSSGGDGEVDLVSRRFR